MKLFAIILGSALLANAASSSAQAPVAAVLKHIEQAERHLHNTEQAVVGARTDLVRRVQQLENEVLGLTQQTSVARRLADESTLSLSQLESRLDAWQQQRDYQNNLLLRFVQQFGNGAAPADFVGLVDVVTTQAEVLQQQFSPGWQDRTLVSNSGALQTMATLAIGPITWYWDETDGSAGFAEFSDDGLLHNSLVLPTAAGEALAQLRTQTSGPLSFDPTMSRVIARHKHQESLPQHLVKGGLWVIPILAFALLASAIACVKVVQLWRLPRVLRVTPAALDTALGDSNSVLASQFKGMQQALFTIAEQHPNTRQCDDLLFLALQEQKQRLERWTGAIAVTASVSPLLGLLGTVSGMIETFKMMTLFGSGDPEVVSGGIAQALITTELGLVVAIPALILSAILSRKARAYYTDLENFALLLSQERDNPPSSPKTRGKNSSSALQQPLPEAVPA